MSFHLPRQHLSGGPRHRFLHDRTCDSEIQRKNHHRLQNGWKYPVHPRKLTAGYPNDEPWKKGVLQKNMAIFGKSMLDFWGVNWCKLYITWSTGAGFLPSKCSIDVIKVKVGIEHFSCLQNATRKWGFAPGKKKTNEIYHLVLQNSTTFRQKKHITEIVHQLELVGHSRWIPLINLSGDVKCGRVLICVIKSSRVWKLQESPHWSNFYGANATRKCERKMWYVHLRYQNILIQKAVMAKPVGCLDIEDFSSQNKLWK